MRLLPASTRLAGVPLAVVTLVVACSTSSGSGSGPQTGADAGTDAAGVDASHAADAGHDAAVEAAAHTDGSLAEGAPAEGGPGDGSTGCVYPTDDLAQASPPQPTPGTCQGDVAATCDPLTHTVVGHACATGEVCATYTVTEHPDGTVETGTGRSYTWAGCLPAGATPCSFAWKPAPPGQIPPGAWTTSYAAQCQGNVALSCEMAPVIGDTAYLDSWAGTATGYVQTSACAANEACADDPNAPGHPACYAAPLVACSPVANSACDGDVLLDCNGNAYQKRVDCSAQGWSCREDCSSAAGFTFQAAECRPPLAPGATQCSPSSYVPSCSDSSTVEDCQLLAPSPTTGDPGGGAVTPDCFLSAGQCVCYPTTHPCSVIGCGVGSTNCQCANVTSQGPECIDATDTLCDPSTTPDSCQGTVAQTCIGYVASVDCSLLGEVCAVAGGHSGCVAAPPTSCPDGGASTSCTGNTLVGCCPASGQFVTDAGDVEIPCAPGLEVKIDCTKIDTASGGLSCTTQEGFASCL
jgi:hypothetical protein